MKGFGLKQIMVAVVALCVIILAALAAVASPPAWKWRVDVVEASGTNEVTLLSTGGQVEWVRFNRIDGPTNQCASAVALVSAADGWSTSLAALSVSNESDAVSAATGSATATNAQWRTGDKILVQSSGITNGTVAFGYWYYE